jgi:hypothetical protein
MQNEKDPTGRDQHELGAKVDAGKPDCSLLGMFGKALRAVSEVGTYGKNKYTRGGWQFVPDGINRYTAAMLRHYFAEHYEVMDKDLPVLHAAQVAWNALARLELLLREKELLEYEKAFVHAMKAAIRPLREKEGEINDNKDINEGNDSEKEHSVRHTYGTVQGTDSGPEAD